MSKRKRTVEIARVYDSPEPGGRYRVLVDRIWPRGVKKDDLQLDAWMKDLAPSDELRKLRKWFGHDPQRWEEFQDRYFQELEDQSETISELLNAAGDKNLLLLFGAKDEQHNNAVALREFLQDRKFV